MIKLLSYLIGKGVATTTEFCPSLQEGVRGLPVTTELPCIGLECGECKDVCPTDAITVTGDGAKAQIELDLGACIGCGLCIDTCPTGTIANDRSTKSARRKRSDLILGGGGERQSIANPEPSNQSGPQGASRQKIFERSIAARVVSTGCSACDLELGAAGNPIFDMERYGIHIVASPRFADVLLVTGPVPKAMHDPLRRCYEAMPEPRLVVAVGTCAISGGVHKNGYTEANGAGNVVPVDVYVPGCPPHPWSIIYGVMTAMNRIP
jgi:Ni,Fe-hydrogenase III small subunit